MKRAAPLLVLVGLLSACVAITVEKRHPRRGPVKEVGYVDYGGGQVRYSAEGWSWIVASRRKTALRLMGANCGPDLKPEITDEYPRMDADAAYNGEDIDASMRTGDEHYHIEHYIHIAYECRPKGGLPAVSTTTARVELSTGATVLASSAAVSVPTTSSSTLAAPEPPR
ncbi:MAG: hypothetical protein ACHQ49_05640 [Elusimicrobiota bacterium]